MKEKVDRQDKQLDIQQEIIHQLVLYSMSSYLFDLLSQLYYRSRDGREYIFTGDESMKRDLRYLRDHGYPPEFVEGEVPGALAQAGRIHGGCLLGKDERRVAAISTSGRKLAGRADVESGATSQVDSGRSLD